MSEMQISTPVMCLKIDLTTIDNAKDYKPLGGILSRFKEDKMTFYDS